MAINFQRARELLQQFSFRQLFAEELNWATPAARAISVDADGEVYAATPIAEQGGMMVFEIASRKDGLIPGRSVQLKLHRRIAQTYAEHILVFVNAARSSSLWVWVKRQDGRLQARDHWYHASQPGDSLLQKLNGIAFTYDQLDEDGRIAIGPVLDAVEASFRAERVTKRFYEQFEKEHVAFLKFINGIPDDAMQKWYASVMLNRLMFIYFIQRKLFLTGDRDYLRHKLEGGEYPQGFYRGFLCPLFFKGFALKEVERSEADRRLLGPVPYLNGGIFQKHEIELLHGKAIEIPDKAFSRIFDFFDRWHWQLDERPLRQDDEINPDVLGYIFEKYINRKQMGAYYTKEDITGYISRNTIHPFLFDAARQKCGAAFEGQASVWTLLRDDPDRYIYEAVRKGVELPLPPEIEAGVPDVSQRGGWNKPAPQEYALPTEIWREVVARRQRYAELRLTLDTRHSTLSINDLITLNLDIERFAQDVVENAEPDLLNAFYKELKAITVLDPTCGSGAFLFAALNILYPLYEACLNRMRVFVEDWQRLGDKTHRNYAKWFASEIRAVEEDHPNQRYFILKTIILNNLYGVDIMKEATEICKLRLFLKLAAQVEPNPVKANLGIEPLPDIDFNIRAGNTLVGFATATEAEAVIRQDLLAYNTVWPEIREKVEDAARHYQLFKEQQTKHGGEVTPDDKRALTDKFAALEDKLNTYLVATYGVRADRKREYDAWLKSHRPFHWFVEFHGTMSAGGFDVIIGNPPWVEYAKVQGEYSLRGLSTLECGNLWAFVAERSYLLLGRTSRIGLIVPMSLVCTERMKAIQSIVKSSGLSWVANFESDSNPGQLFDGVKQNVTILLGKRHSECLIHTTRLLRFFQEFRDKVFTAVEYTQCPPNPLPFGFPKVGTMCESTLLRKLFTKKPLAANMIHMSGQAILVHRIAHYYIKCFDFVPYFRSDRDGVKKSEDYKEYTFAPPIGQYVAAINGSTFYFYWQVFFDAFKAGKLCVESFPFGTASDTGIVPELNRLARALMNDMKRHATRLKADYAATGHVEYDQFCPRESKAIMDQIDRELARHYEFTDEELDFIINYDIKYRMGLAGSKENDEE